MHTIKRDAWVSLCSVRLTIKDCFDYLVEEPNDLASYVLAPGLLVVHDTGGGGQDDVAELTRRKKSDNPLLEVAEPDVETGRDDTSLVET